jgi:hypothetical protein
MRPSPVYHTPSRDSVIEDPFWEIEKAELATVSRMVSAPTKEAFENIAKDLMYICNNGGGEEHTHKTMSPNDNEPIVQVNDGDVNL